MRHQVFGRKLHRNKKQRENLFRQQVCFFVEKDKLITSLAKAKAIQPEIERFVTKAKVQSDTTFRYLMSKLNNKKIARKLLQVGVQFNKRNGGYTKLLKLASQEGDRSKKAIILWSEDLSIQPKVEVKEKETADMTKIRENKPNHKVKIKTEKKEK